MHQKWQAEIEKLPEMKCVFVITGNWKWGKPLPSLELKLDQVTGNSLGMEKVPS